jgi:hypothetical protein
MDPKQGSMDLAKPEVIEKVAKGLNIHQKPEVKELIELIKKPNPTPEEFLYTALINEGFE